MLGFNRYLVFPGPKLSLQVAAIAERLIAGLATATECNTIANLIGGAIGGFNRNLAAHSKRPDFAGLAIFFYYSDGGLEFRFDFFPCLFVPGNQTARWTIARFFFGDSLGFRII